ncbi:MAG: hypothetical protein CMN91_08540 [Synechococcus sp. ARS1019]|nr:hypothetical protein [Synechococcus sp. ARS1019]|tara:strand:+ start:138 stop:383 length:246 start_codon:yes stop_codon:yes gene_type:complete
MPNPTAAIMAQASTAQLKEYLLGFTAEAAVMALDELIRRGEDGSAVVQQLEDDLQPSLDRGMAMTSCRELIAILKAHLTNS